jgi:hypothetical protein
MIIRRSNGNTRATTADDCFAAAERHYTRQMATSLPQSGLAAATEMPKKNETGSSAAEAGDIIYGAKAIAFFIFGDDSNRSRRRVFNLWAHYSARKERAGFFKLKGALCLSKTQWREFHGLG